MIMAQNERTIDEEQSVYFGLLAEIGHTKHIGGTAATVRLAEIIDPQPGDEVLDVGCGVGIGAVFLAKQFGCRVLGVDITPRMIERARERAERHGVADLVEFRIADMHDLPFDNGRFSGAIAESVLTFSADKMHVVNELIRVVKPGGMIAFTEAIWVQQPLPGKADFMARAGGMPQGILAHEAWREIMEASTLEPIIAEVNPITAREESKNQAGRASFGDYMRSFGGFFKAIARSEYRQVFRTAAGSMPKDYYKYIGYGVYGGKKLGTEN
jgi:ubiquinone/menaquinone biosynthesis C-methylase UbiE